MQIDMTTWIIVGIVAGLTWLILVLAICKFSEMYNDFKRLQKDVSSNLAVISSNLKSSQATVSEMLIEQRRTNKIVLELLNHNKDFLNTLEVEG
jgi:hypothetical protein